MWHSMASRLPITSEGDTVTRFEEMDIHERLVDNGRKVRLDCIADRIALRWTAGTTHATHDTLAAVLSAHVRVDMRPFVNTVVGRKTKKGTVPFFTPTSRVQIEPERVLVVNAAFTVADAQLVYEDVTTIAFPPPVQYVADNDEDPFLCLHCVLYHTVAGRPLPAEARFEFMKHAVITAWPQEDPDRDLAVMMIFAVLGYVDIA